MPDNNFDKKLFDSFEQLAANEQLVLKRIAQVPNGGNLFFANPIELMRLIGVELTAEARQRFDLEYPFLQSNSRTAFDAIRTSSEPQRSTIQITGLFGRRNA